MCLLLGIRNSTISNRESWQIHGTCHLTNVASSTLNQCTMHNSVRYQHLPGNIFNSWVFPFPPTKTVAEGLQTAATNGAGHGLHAGLGRGTSVVLVDLWLWLKGVGRGGACLWEVDGKPLFSSHFHDGLNLASGTSNNQQIQDNSVETKKRHHWDNSIDLLRHQGTRSMTQDWKQGLQKRCEPQMLSGAVANVYSKGPKKWMKLTV